MPIPTKDNHESIRTYHTAEDLFRNPDCTTVVVKGGTSENLLLERSANEYRLLLSNYQDPPQVLCAGTFEQIYRYTISSHPDKHLRIPCWLDISHYPDFPPNTWYYLFQKEVKVYIARESPYNTNHSNYVIYGPIDDMGQPDEKGIRIVHPQQGWLVVETPPRTVLLSDLRWVMHARSRIDLWVRLKVIRWLERLHLKPLSVVETPGYFKVYGKPSADWRTAEQHHYP